MKRVILAFIKSEREAKKTIIVKSLRKVVEIVFLPLGFVSVVIIRMIKPWFLVRFQIMISERIGHYAANTELYLCEKDAKINQPKQRYIDIWHNNWPVCNRQLATMWSRVLHILPFFLVAPLIKANKILPGGSEHVIYPSMSDRDKHGFLDHCSTHLIFTKDEEERGKKELANLGIPDGSKFICLNARDSSYLENALPWRSWDYHNYRDSKIGNYRLAAEYLAEKGYYVVRMGARVLEPFNSKHPKIIDYAYRGLRSDFMDIYLGAKCYFCISTGTGFDAVPYAFRRPIAYVNMCPFSNILSSSKRFVSITKHYYCQKSCKRLSASEILKRGLGSILYTSDFKKAGVELVENTPEEIRDAVLEMEQRLLNGWEDTSDDKKLQSKFWNTFKEGVNKQGNCSGEHVLYNSKFGTLFLRKNPDFVFGKYY